MHPLYQVPWFAHAGEEIGIYIVTYPWFIYTGYPAYFLAGANEGAWPYNYIYIYIYIESHSSWHTGFASYKLAPSYHATSSTQTQQSSSGRSWFRSSNAGWNFLSLSKASGKKHHRFSPDDFRIPKLVKRWGVQSSNISKLKNAELKNAEAFIENFKVLHIKDYVQRNFHLTPTRTATGLASQVSQALCVPWPFYTAPQASTCHIKLRR